MLFLLAILTVLLVISLVYFFAEVKKTRVQKKLVKQFDAENLSYKTTTQNEQSEHTVDLLKIIQQQTLLLEKIMEGEEGN